MLQDLFIGKYGAMRVHMPEDYKNPKDRQSYIPPRYKDFAFVHFTTIPEAKRILQESDEMFINNVLVQVEQAKVAKPREGEKA